MSLRGLAADQLQLAQVAIGLSIGTAARYAMRLQDGQPIGKREIGIDIGLLGFVALMTGWTVQRLGATGFGATMIAALFAIGQDRIIRLVRRNFERRAAKILNAAGLGDDEPPPPAPPAPAPYVAPAQPAEPDDKLARVRGPLLDAFGRKPRRPPDDMIEHLKKLED